MEQGMDPDVKKYLRKILNSLFFGLSWLALNVLAGLYWEWAIVDKKLSIYNILFFTWFVVSLVFLLYYYYRLWKK
jgi:hypothetical protein